MHVDGFRFDLAPTLGRELYEVDRQGRFFAMLQQDPVLSKTKLIAEPWDLGEGGHQLGNFPPGWTEWNGKYRDTVRRFWKGEPGQVSDLAYRLSGSSDLYDTSDRNPYASINFITCHDGFTLQDLVSYDQKHNEANQEGNRDGTDANWSRNWGAEGASDDPAIQSVREQVKRSLLATLAYSQGVPMLLAGDEMGRTQLGNNNAYCQDNEISWVNWVLTREQRELLEFTRRIFAIRRENPVFRRRSFFRGRRVTPAGGKDVAWIHPDGTEMTDGDWGDPKRHALGMLIPGHATDEKDERGQLIAGDTQLLLLNGGPRAVDFKLPLAESSEGCWREEVNTAREGSRIIRGTGVRLAAHSLILLAHQGVT
jgi:glycogen operon protein